MGVAKCEVDKEVSWKCGVSVCIIPSAFALSMPFQALSKSFALRSYVNTLS